MIGHTVETAMPVDRCGHVAQRGAWRSRGGIIATVKYSLVRDLSGGESSLNFALETGPIRYPAWMKIVSKVLGALATTPVPEIPGPYCARCRPSVT